MSADAIEGYHSCIVIGAGLAGLYAAQQLKERYPDVLVVEAQDRVGGRVRQVSLKSYHTAMYSVLYTEACPPSRALHPHPATAATAATAAAAPAAADCIMMHSVCFLSP